MRHLRQVRIRQSGRLREGPRGAVDHPRCRGTRRAEAGRNDRRRNGGQYRDRDRAGRQCTRLQDDHRDARQPGAREDGYAARAGRAAGAGAADQVRQSRPLRPHLASAGGGDRGRDLGQPVRQHRQPARAYRQHCARIVGPAGRPDRRLHLRCGDRRHYCRRRPGAERKGRKRPHRADRPAWRGAV